MTLIFDEFTKITEVCRMMPIEKVNLRCQFHIKFHEESKKEFYFNLRSYPMKDEVTAE